MSLICQLSGQVPEEPVASPQGNVFEKRLIEKHLETAGKCPVTSEELAVSDLIPLRVNKVAKPRPLSATSIPGMLTLFQNEWDAVMTETFQLKENLDATRQQLAHTLYQHDAACRVIARVLRERDMAREQVTALQAALAQARATGMVPGDVDMEPEAVAGMTEDIMARLDETAAALTGTRKKRKAPPTQASVDTVKGFSCSGSHPIHQSTAPGILCVDHMLSVPSVVCTGGKDTVVAVYNTAQKKVLGKMTGHTKPITAVKMLESHNLQLVLSASEDCTARIWAASDGWASSYEAGPVVKMHSGVVCGVSAHPSGDYFITGSHDKSWAFHAIDGRTITHNSDLDYSVTSIKFHPDGRLLATGTSTNEIKIWDSKTQSLAESLSGHQGTITSLSFSENGYYLATGSQDGTAKLWDLRKAINFHTVNVGTPVNNVAFDHFGQYLAVCSSSVKVLNFADKTTLVDTVELGDHEGPVMGAIWGQDAKSLFTVSMDRMLRAFG
mmetsp:Transcript_8125/g.17660  ORF Transcript_8125/g.17660 Transcript_8125/m.17660 type:complete len:498 (-) Transcript_8125:255-1748(-)